MTTWFELKAAIRATGTFNRRTIMEIAIGRTRYEIKAFAALGLRRTWRQEFGHQLRLVWQVAKTAMDSLVTERMLSAASPAERAARQLELRAEIAETSIPPRSARAAELRETAAVCRAAVYHG